MRVIHGLELLLKSIN